MAKAKNKNSGEVFEVIEVKENRATVKGIEFEFGPGTVFLQNKEGELGTVHERVFNQDYELLE